MLHLSPEVHKWILIGIAGIFLAILVWVLIRFRRGIGDGIAAGGWGVQHVFEVIHARIVRAWVIIWERRGRFALLFLALGVFVYLAFLGGAQFLSGNLFPDNNTEQAVAEGAIVVEAVSGDPLRGMQLVDAYEATKVDTTVGTRIVDNSLRKEAWERYGRQHGFVPGDDGVYLQTKEVVTPNSSTVTVQAGKGAPPATQPSPPPAHSAKSTPSSPKAGNGQ